ncbi:MAG: inositol monophosphatase [bacterium]
MTNLPHNSTYYLDKLRQLHIKMRDHLRKQMVTQDQTTLSAATAARDGDTIYRIDEFSEELLLEYCREWAKETPFVLIAEGISGDGWLSLPDGASAQDATFLLIVDPIDGTRPLMYDKRSAWLLTGIAPNLGRKTTLADITIAMQTELPITRQNLAYHLWAVKGQGAQAELHDLVLDQVNPASLHPSRAQTLEHGFASLVKFFPAGKRELVEIECRLFEALVGDLNIGNPVIFDDEYTSTGGQLFELMVGHDRFIADLRPLLYKRYQSHQKPLCAHPYDIGTELIAREAGVIITDEKGNPLSSLLDIQENVAWIGYANQALRDKIEPILLSILESSDLL